MVFLPMSYLFGTRATVPITALTHELRGELFAEPYETIDWVKNRSNVCPSDIQHSHSWLLDVATVGLNVLEPSFHRVCSLFVRGIIFDLNTFSLNYFLLSQWPMNKMRKRATDYIASYVHAEDLQTNHICIGPVNKVLNMCVTYHFDGASSPLFQKHLARIDDYLWVSEDGMKMQGYNGSQLWDTSFSVCHFVSDLTTN
jgi:cycloartenol synthase